MNNKRKRIDNRGISLVTVIITVIVIILLALITFYNQFTTTDSASFSKFAQEYQEVYKSVETVRLGNAKTSTEDINNGFVIVNVSGDIPYGFKSISEEDTQAYLVDLNYIGCDALLTGKDYAKYKAGGGTITVGVDDVYVYDARGILYYIKGFLYDGITYFEGTRANNSTIRIADILKTPLENSVKVDITIESEKEISSVTVSGTPATLVGSGQYSIELSQNGNYDIIARDVDGNQARSTVSITSLGISGAEPVVTATVTNGIESNGIYTITSGTAKINITSENASELFIGTDISQPTEWFAFSQNVERYFETSGNYVLYIYVRNSNGASNTSPFVLRINVDLENVRPDFPGETIDDGEIRFDITPANSIWAKAKTVKITYPEGMQSNGYTSSYATKTGAGIYNNYKIVYDKEVDVPITKSGTSVGAKITYGSDYTTKEIASSEVEVEKIDSTPPQITSFEKFGSNKIKGIAQDSESGLASAPYLITMNYIDFTVKDVNEYTWEDTGIAKLFDSGRYYFYAKDDVGNVSVKSVNFDAPDGTDPVIDSVKATPELDHVIIKLVAHDNIGIVGYAIIKDNADEPTSWTNISSTQQIAIENNVTEDGKYYVWVIDNAGNKAVESVQAVTYKLPVLSSQYPETIRVNEGEQAQFRVVITTAGYPDEYEYIWQVSKDNGETWSRVEGKQSATYTIASAKVEDDGNIYKCTISNERGSVESKIARLEVFGITSDKPSLTATLDKEMVLAGLTINNGASTTISSTLTLQIFAINAYEVNISETGSKSSTWLPYQNTISYTLNNKSNGPKTIYVWIRDAQGNELNKVVQAQIEKTN